MTNFFKQLDSLVDRWLSFKMKAAIDERFFIEKHIRYSTMMAANQFNVGYWLASRKHIYDFYRLGDFQKTAYEFDKSIERAVLESFKPEIKIKPSKSKKKQFEKPPFNKMSDFLTDREIRDIKKDALKSIKDFIVINEAARKAKIEYFNDDNKWIEYRRKAINSDNIRKIEQLALSENTDDALNKNTQADKSDTTNSNNSKEVKKNMCSSFSNKLELDTVRSYFEVLKTRVSKGNNEPFLSDEKFEMFINVAFCSGKLNEKIKLNKKPKGEKQLIVKLFYEFYNTTYEKLFGYQKMRDKYIKLLSDNFMGFEFDSLKNNFGNYTKGSISDCEKYIK